MLCEQAYPVVGAEGAGSASWLSSGDQIYWIIGIILVVILGLNIIERVWPGVIDVRGPAPIKKLGVGGASILVIAVGLVTAVSYWFNSRGTEERPRGKLTLVEGRLVDYEPAPRMGGGLEQFTVEGVRFSFSPHSLAAGLHERLGDIGVEQGDYVKVHYSPTAIWRVEVCEE